MKGCTRTLSMSNVVRRALEIAAPTNGRENERRPKKRRILGLSQAYGVFLDSLFPFPCPFSRPLFRPIEEGTSRRERGIG